MYMILTILLNQVDTGRIFYTLETTSNKILTADFTVCECGVIYNKPKPSEENSNIYLIFINTRIKTDFRYDSSVDNIKDIEYISRVISSIFKIDQEKSIHILTDIFNHYGLQKGNQVYNCCSH